jgi:hypothetical protein
MIPGVHASIAVDRKPEEVRAMLDRKGWPWLGRRGPLGSREISLDGSPPRAFRLRVFGTHRGLPVGPTWRILLEHPDDRPAPHSLLELELFLAPLPGDCSGLRLDGMFSQVLLHGVEATIPHAVARLAANAHARSLLEQVTTILEGQVKQDAGRSRSPQDERVRVGEPGAPRTRRT